MDTPCCSHRLELLVHVSKRQRCAFINKMYTSLFHYSVGCMLLPNGYMYYQIGNIVPLLAIVLENAERIFFV